MGKRSSSVLNYPLVDKVQIFPVDNYRDSLQFLFSLSLWVGKNLPIGIEMDTQALLPATKTFKKRASIKQSNELTEAAYYLPLQAKRVLWLCLMQAYFNDNQEDDSDVLPLFKISVSDYVKYFNVATSVASRDVKAGVNALGESTVTFYPKDFFCPKDTHTGIVELTGSTYCIHHFNGSWVAPTEKKKTKARWRKYRIERIKNSPKILLRKLIGDDRVESIKRFLRRK